MTETAVELCSLTLQVPRSLVARLDVLAEKSGRSASMFASEALLQYLEQAETEVEAVLEAIEELDSGAPGIPHEELVAWLRTWGLLMSGRLRGEDPLATAGAERPRGVANVHRS